MGDNWCKSPELHGAIFCFQRVAHFVWLVKRSHQSTWRHTRRQCPECISFYHSGTQAECTHQSPRCHVHHDTHALCTVSLAVLIPSPGVQGSFLDFGWRGVDCFGQKMVCCRQRKNRFLFDGGCPGGLRIESRSDTCEHTQDHT